MQTAPAFLESGPPETRVTARERGRRSYLFEVGLGIAAVLFGWLAITASSVPYFALDLQITRAIQSVQSPAIVMFLGALTWIGLPPQSNVIFGSLVVILFLVGRRWESAGLLFAGAGTAGLWYLLEALVGRPRPTPDLVQVSSQIAHGSFPSGHAMNLTAMLGFLAYLIWVHIPPAWWRTLLLAILSLPVLFVGVARVHAGQHWPSDVLGGYLLGIIWLALTVKLYRHFTGEREAEREPTAPTPAA